VSASGEHLALLDDRLNGILEARLSGIVYDVGDAPLVLINADAVTS